MVKGGAGAAYLLVKCKWYKEMIVTNIANSDMWFGLLPSHVQVLNTLKQKLDHFSYSVDNFEDLLGKSKRFLRLRELESGILSSSHGRKNLGPGGGRVSRPSLAPVTPSNNSQRITPEKVTTLLSFT